MALQTWGRFRGAQILSGPAARSCRRQNLAAEACGNLDLCARAPRFMGESPVGSVIVALTLFRVNDPAQHVRLGFVPKASAPSDAVRATPDQPRAGQSPPSEMPTRSPVSVSLSASDFRDAVAMHRIGFRDALLSRPKKIINHVKQLTVARDHGAVMDGSPPDLIGAPEPWRAP